MKICEQRIVSYFYYSFSRIIRVLPFLIWYLCVCQLTEFIRYDKSLLLLNPDMKIYCSLQV
jgi:hypothetical protein